MKILEKPNEDDLINYIVSQLNKIIYEDRYRPSSELKDLNVKVFNDIHMIEAALARCLKTLSNPKLNANQNAFMKMMYV